MTTLGIIGSGNIGTVVAKQAVAAGYDVVLANSRGPESLREKAAELGVRAGTAVEAATAGDIVVVTIPFGRYAELPAEQLAGKVVIDTLNYYPSRDGRIEELDEEQVTTAEVVQRHLKDSRTVKTFNNITAAVHLDSLPRPSGAADRSALPLSGNDAEARATVVELLDKLGWDAVDVGPLTESWRHEPETAVYVDPYLGAGITFEDLVGGAQDAGSPAPAAEIEKLIATAHRPPVRDRQF
ncbi:NAD(P)-binding domain-containing protein [Kribbella sandramycini]|uniref:NAD(P)-binding domain-containing protein n=1 Tax=Kribbella sandramycini TaxID=60450 RepID=A0A7Y4L1J5_9ACTN|nr:NAD(P)-binding domain-containing protein [Kribbella sandramycini]MBB6564943.1 putative dinucleotide-binding enzyme [Kribbella sandramycini]NOL42639.1 NAD(P)-binding domain-containing protein [Kribbella sandramycini]